MTSKLLLAPFFIYDVWTPSSLIKNTMEILINSRWVLFKPISAFGGSCISDEIVFERMLLGFTDSKSTMVQIMAWCLYATSLYRAIVDQVLCRHMASLVHNELSEILTWASYQIGKIAGCACAGNVGNVFPANDFKGNPQLAIPACIKARASRTCRNACRDL